MMETNSKTIYFPGLSGLRAISAIAVVVSHITLSLHEFNLDPFIFGRFEDGQPKGISLAGYGVSIFFVLSGFLITYLLESEKEKQNIDIRKFYMRRILRIWPLYYLYFFICVLLLLFTSYSINTTSFLLYLFYAANIPFILGTSLPMLAHYWSLGVEEQFYLFWPWLCRVSSKTIVTISLICVVLLISAKVYLHFFLPGSKLELIIHVTRFHCMMIGAIGAILYRSNHFLLVLVNNKITQAIAWTIVVLAAINRYHIASVVDNEIMAVVALCLIIGQIEIKNRIVNLETKFFDFFGKISYGLYIVHPLIIFLFSGILSTSTLPSGINYILVYGAVLSTSILTAYLSYMYFEKYFLKFKKRFEVIRSRNTMTETME